MTSQPEGTEGITLKLPSGEVVVIPSDPEAKKLFFTEFHRKAQADEAAKTKADRIELGYSALGCMVLAPPVLGATLGVGYLVFRWVVSLGS